MFKAHLLAVCFVVGTLGLAACGADETLDGDALRAETIVRGLSGPTQLTIAPDGLWYVAQLSGQENDATGQVLRIDPERPEATPIVVRDGLDKPTGVAVFDNRLWVMERQRLSFTALDGSGPVVVVDEMTFNGRSEGSLTVDGDRLLFNTSGRISARTEQPQDPTMSSGVLWSVNTDGDIAAVADGFKHAYAHVRDATGTLFTTEMADGTFDGTPAVDELVAVAPGRHHGWPHCVGNNRLVEEFAAGTVGCDGVPASQAVFAPGATPTAVVEAPWDPGTLLIALWNRGEIVAVDTGGPTSGPAETVVVSETVDRPQSLVVDGPRVLAVDHTSGEIVALSAAS